MVDFTLASFCSDIAAGAEASGGSSFALASFYSDFKIGVIALRG